MEAGSLNKAQIEVLDALASLHTEEEILELKKLISRFFADRAEKELEKLSDAGVWNDQLLKSFEASHYRTPYK